MFYSVKLRWFVQPLLRCKSKKYCIVLGFVCSQDAKRTRHIVICGLSCSTVFPTLSHKRHDLREKNCY